MENIITACKRLHKYMCTQKKKHSFFYDFVCFICRKRWQRPSLGQTCAIPAIKCDHSHNVSLHVYNANRLWTKSARNIHIHLGRSHVRCIFGVCFYWIGVLVSLSLILLFLHKMKWPNRNDETERRRKKNYDHESLKRWFINSQNSSFFMVVCYLFPYTFFDTKKHSHFRRHRHCVCVFIFHFQFSASSLPCWYYTTTPLTVCSACGL